MMDRPPLAALSAERDLPSFVAGRHGERAALYALLDALRFTSTAAKDLGTAVLNVPPSGLANELALFASIVESLGGTDGMAKQMADAAGGVTSAKIASVGLSAQRADRLNLSINDMLVRSKRSGGLWRNRMLIIAVDEIQAIVAEERRTLKALHDGLHGCPILLLGAGLQHATARLAADLPAADGRLDTSGISRFAERLTLARWIKTMPCRPSCGALTQWGIAWARSRRPLLPRRRWDFRNTSTATCAAPSKRRWSMATSAPIRPRSPRWPSATNSACPTTKSAFAAWSGRREC